jgi:hypothetical protein
MVKFKSQLQMVLRVLMNEILTIKSNIKAIYSYLTYTEIMLTLFFNPQM